MKKGLLVLMIMLSFVATSVIYASNIEALCGDLNKDGYVNNSDVKYLGNYLNGASGYEVELDTADVNDDGLIDWYDYKVLKAYVADSSSELPNPYSVGDVNRTDTIDQADINYLGKILNGQEGLIIINSLCDVNCDGSVDWNDYKVLKKHVAKESGYETLPKEYAVGDLNRDYIVDDKDLGHMGRYLNGIKGYDVIIKLADLNLDGIVDWEDYKIIKYHLAGNEGFETLPREYAVGDVNKDFKVNTADINYLGKILNGQEGLTIINRLCDVNNDGLIDWNDYKVLKQYVAGATGYETLPKEYVIGDLNRDYIVDDKDLGHMGRYLNGTTGYDVIVKLADLNGDLKVDWTDYKLLKTKLNEQTTESDTYSNNYYFNLLSDEEKELYIKIDEAVKNKEVEVEVNVTQESVSLVFEAYRNDNAQVFYLTNSYTIVTTSVNGVQTLKLNLSYIDTENNIDTMNKEIEAVADGIIARVIKSDMTDYEKEVALHDELASTVRYYDFENLEDVPYIKHTAYGALVEKSAVCDGYANAFKLLLDKIGIESMVVKGTLNGEAHAWNLVNLEDKYYNVDVTADAFELGENLYSTHIYFNNTDDEIKLTHKLDGTYTIPSCYSNEYDYFEKSDKVLNEEDDIYNKLNEIVEASAENSILEFRADEVHEIGTIVNTLYNLDFNGWKTNGVTEISYIEENDIYIFEK